MKYLIFPIVVILLAMVAYVVQHIGLFGSKMIALFSAAYMIIYFGIGLIIFLYAAFIRNELYAAISGCLLSILFAFISIGHSIEVGYFILSSIAFLIAGPALGLYSAALTTKIDGVVAIWWRHLVVPSILLSFWYMLTAIIVLI